MYFDIGGAPAASPYIRKQFDFDAAKGRMPPGVVPTEVRGWLLQGTIREDDGTIFLLSINPFDDPLGQINRFCNHFYDPVYNAKLSNPGCLGSDLTSAPIWAFGVQEPT